LRNQRRRGATFQSTPLREGRLQDGFPYPFQQDFNPRPCARGDLPCQAAFELRQRFQSTPLREGRLDKNVNPSQAKSFQSTPLREGRRRYREQLAERGVFQSTPLREGRQQ